MCVESKIGWRSFLSKRTSFYCCCGAEQFGWWSVKALQHFDFGSPRLQRLWVVSLSFPSFCVCFYNSMLLSIIPYKSKILLAPFKSFFSSLMSLSKMHNLANSRFTKMRINWLYQAHKSFFNFQVLFPLIVLLFLKALDNQPNSYRDWEFKKTLATFLIALWVWLQIESLRKQMNIFDIF